MVFAIPGAIAVIFLFIYLKLKDPDPPNINCTDVLGNTALHCAAYRGHKEVAVVLLENGVDSSIKNSRGW